MIRKLNWWVFVFLALAIGLYPIIYFVIDREFGLLGSKSPELLHDSIWNLAFYTHIIFGGISLLAGWSQFSAKIRSNSLSLHRNLGKVYVISVLFSGISGIYIALYATAGIIASLGFLCLAILWLYTTVQAYVNVRRSNIDEHQIFMIYSYALCFAAVTLRIWLPLLSNAFGDFIPAYRLVAWLCWVPNLFVAYYFTRRI